MVVLVVVMMTAMAVWLCICRGGKQGDESE
jgi:hypothetical protein